MFQDAEGKVLGIHILGEVVLSYPAVIEIAIILLAAFLSFKTTDASIRRENHFTWSAIKMCIRDSCHCGSKCQRKG